MPVQISTPEEGQREYSWRAVRTAVESTWSFPAVALLFAGQTDAKCGPYSLVSLEV